MNTKTSSFIKNKIVLCIAIAFSVFVTLGAGITQAFDPLEGPSNATFDSLNPLKTESSPHADQLSTPGGVVSRALEFILPMAGLILFVMLVWGGFEILASSATSKSVENGKKRITAALVGFLLLFSSYWIAQILQELFGIRIL
jgi:hypothetical protein